MQIDVTPEYERIKGLDTRQWDHETTEQAVAYWTKRFSRGTGMQLWPAQAQALSELATQGSCVASIPIGGGKTLLTALSPLVARAQRPVLFLEAQLTPKTEIEFENLRQHWHLHPNLQIWSIESVSTKKNRDLLDRLNPDFIVIDEAHRLRYHPASDETTLSTRTVRFMRFAASRYDARWMILSGSLMKMGSLGQVYLFANWALKQGSPLPLPKDEMRAWCAALDERLGYQESRVGVGALPALDPDADGSTKLEKARKAVHMRMAKTPGMFFVKETKLDVNLTIREEPLETPPEILELVDDLEQHWVTPNGEELEDSLSVRRHGRELSCGFYQRWTPPAPKPWLESRRVYNRFIKEMKGKTVFFGTENEHTLDSPAQIEDAFPMAPEILQWREIEPTFVPNPVPYWVSDYAVRGAQRWAERQDRPFVIWVEHVNVAKRVAKELGLPYYGAGTEAAKAVVGLRSSAVLSFAHIVGKNLQFFSRGLCMSCPSNEDDLNQMIGRLYRPGQTKDVEISFFLNTDSQMGSLLDSLQQSKTRDLFSGSTSRIMKARWEIPGINAREWRAEVEKEENE